MPFIEQLVQMPDNGPIYRETTDLSRFIVEPWNALSSLTFLIPAFIFLGSCGAITVTTLFSSSSVRLY